MRSHVVAAASYVRNLRAALIAGDPWAWEDDDDELEVPGSSSSAGAPADI
jgi:hypothetical protein